MVLETDVGLCLNRWVLGVSHGEMSRWHFTRFVGVAELRRCQAIGTNAPPLLFDYSPKQRERIFDHTGHVAWRFFRLRSVVRPIVRPFIVLAMFVAASHGP